MARPTKYTPEIEKTICDRLRAGCTRKAAYQSNGVSHEGFARWMRRFSAFRESVLRAEAEAEIRFTLRVTKEVHDKDGDWRAAVEWLKRRRREDWGDKVDFGKYTDEDLIAEAKKLFGGTLEEILAAPTGDSPHE